MDAILGPGAAAPDQAHVVHATWAFKSGAAQLRGDDDDVDVDVDVVAAAATLLAPPLAPPPPGRVCARAPPARLRSFAAVTRSSGKRGAEPSALREGERLRAPAARAAPPHVAFSMWCTSRGRRSSYVSPRSTTVPYQTPLRSQ
eukprot:scaffold1762_cov383-Prasinococcus_capsulatus_cf.AAC.6